MDSQVQVCRQRQDCIIEVLPQPLCGSAGASHVGGRWRFGVRRSVFSHPDHSVKPPLSALQEIQHLPVEANTLMVLSALILIPRLSSSSSSSSASCCYCLFSLLLMVCSSSCTSLPYQHQTFIFNTAFVVSLQNEMRKQHPPY